MPDLPSPGINESYRQRDEARIDIQRLRIKLARLREMSERISPGWMGVPIAEWIEVMKEER